MHHRFFALLGMAGFLLLAPAAADASCCDKQAHKGHESGAACCEMACCKDQKPAAEPDAIALLLSLDPQFNPAPPVRQLAEVWFTQPTLIGRTIVQGRYVIEHDNNRMARGEPCTHVYAYDDLTTPVAAFHCTHLERDRADQNTVTLATAADGRMKVLTEFQFAGESAAHGYPTVR